MHRFLPLLVLVLFLVGIFTFQPLRREIAYKLGMSGDPTTSCCGDPSQIDGSSGDFEENAKKQFLMARLLTIPKLL